MKKNGDIIHKENVTYVIKNFCTTPKMKMNTGYFKKLETTVIIQGNIEELHLIYVTYVIKHNETFLL